MGKTKALRTAEKIVSTADLQPPNKREEFLFLVDEFLSKFKSKTFQNRCDKQLQQGLNPLKIWLEKHNFKLTKERDKNMTAKRLIHEADSNSTGTPDLFNVVTCIPETLTYSIDLFLSEFDYYDNMKSNRAIALRILASIVSALNCSVEAELKRG